MITKKNIVWGSIIIVLIMGFYIGKDFFVEKHTLYDAQDDNMIVETIDEDLAKSQEEQETEKHQEPKEVTVFISGQVKNQQVVTLENGKRLDDAVKMCGGLDQEADLNRVNLAQLLEDQGHYVIPKIGEEIGEIPQGAQNTQNTPSSSQEDNSSGLININTADKTTLMQLPGVGDKTADKIIQHRENVSKFDSVENIKDVSGIGDKKFQDLKDKITV